MKIVMFALFLSAHCELTTARRRKHFYFSNDTTWTEAQRHCKAYYVDLSTIDNQEDFKELNIASGGVSLTNIVWVGLKLISYPNWQWSDGSNGFIQWNAGQPEYRVPDLCAGVLNVGLEDYPCSFSRPYFCYKWDSSVSEWIVVKENKSWEDALQYCRTHHTDLASLPTNLTQDQKNTAETSSVWTGLRLLAGSWFWLSDEDLGNLTVQLPVCPANYTYCGSLNMKTQHWENRDCMEKLNFVCY